MDRPMKLASTEVPTVPDAEARLLGSLLMDNDQVWAVRPLLQPQDFDNVQYSLIYSTIVACLDSGKPANLVTLVPVLANGSSARIGADLLVSLMESESSGQRALAYAELVKDAADRRRLIMTASKAIATATT